METQTRLRPPHLHPSWTDARHSGGYPSTPYSARSSIYSPSMRSPNMPSPMYPRSPGYDNSMSRHERSMVGRLDQRNWPRQPESPTRSAPRSLSPIAELNGGLRRASVAYPPQYLPPARSPHSLGKPVEYGFYDYPNRPTLADETRSILLSRAAEPQVPTSSSLAERRRSLPPSFPAARRAGKQRHHELQAWGHVYFGNGSEADCFVSPVALRRLSEASSEEENSASREKEYRRQSRLTIRARVRPRALDRKPFLLQRTFDMDELRATVPDPDLASSPDPRRLSAELSRNDYDERRQSSASARREPGVELDKIPIRSTKTVPVHLQYARVYFPVIAALIYSRHIQRGDIIDFPLPHPEAWTQTVAYAYTGQGELTDAVRQNILYLGGKV
ncbi:hypothetical protein B0H66DRAFT_13033 [Apodospora peruviana]|uniref:Uncharacterized protein n=1 Tax=Apodospora peruviana TaxID=516989 RepID=A0AAE0IPQ3_9PEZI|nr:hypothetical protein B0H66DRAFT_13033 [Apodospora peruviana]